MEVFIVQPNREYEDMFKKKGWTLASSLTDFADLIQFTGGSDVTPQLYGEGKHRTTWASAERDRGEAIVFEVGRQYGIPMAGICRGGQFLNVMCGGKMWQDVDNHGISGTHIAHCHVTDADIQVTSTHHQMMIPGPTGDIIMTAAEATRKESCNDIGRVLTRIVQPDEHSDIEGVHYIHENVMCFQPHPEFEYRDELANHYFMLLEKLLFPNDLK